MFVLLAACGSDDPIGTSDTGSILGTVVETNGAAVASATVELTGNGQGARTTSTGADGVYGFADVPPGTYTLTIMPPNGFTVGATGTTSVTVAKDAQANAAAFVLERIVINGGITGTVIDFDAESGVANALVELSGNGQAARSTSSGADGRYAFADLVPGTYALAVTPPAGFTLSGLGTRSVYVPGGVQADASAFALRHDSCLVARPDFGGPASAEDLALFAYDVNAPLDLQQTVQSIEDSVQISTISYTSPDGGLVPGILVEPIGRTGLRPGLVFMHASPSPSALYAPYLKIFAMSGAVVIAIDAPYFRRGGQDYPLFTTQDRDEHIQLIKDLQRAVDILVARGDVDVERIGFLGNSYGGMVGAHFVGVERRLRAAILSTASGGKVTHQTSAVNSGPISNLTCAARNAWFDAMIPIEAIRYIPHASGTSLLFQIAKFDMAVLPADAQALYDAAPDPKEVIYYDAEHNLNAQAIGDRFVWLDEMLGFDP